MSTASAQVARLIALTPYLRARPDGVPLSELAEEFGVTARTMRADLQTLVMCGLPDLLPDDLVDIDLEAFEDDPEGIVRINNADFMPRPTRLRSGEAASLLVALARMADEADEGTRERIADLRTKLEAATTEGASGKVSVLPSHVSATQAETRRILEQALAEDRQVRLSHLNTTRDEITERVVDPVAVVSEGGKGYLDAWCHLTDSRRLFRVDRIQQLVLLESPRVHGDLPARTSGELFEPAPTHVEARLRLHRGARWITSYHPVTSSFEDANGDLEVTLVVSDPRWLVRTVLSAAPDVVVLSPPEYSTLVAEAAAATLAAYDGDQ